MPNILSVRSVEEARAELLDQIEAINEVAKGDERDLSAEEMAKVDELFEAHEIMAADLERAAKYERAIKESAQRRGSTPEVVIPGDPPERKLPAVAAGPAPKHFKGEDARQDAYDSGMWLKATLLNDAKATEHCQDRGIEIRLDAQTVDDDARGGYLVPAPLSSAIIDVRNEFGIANRLADTVPMTSETLDMNKRAGGLTVYSPGEEEAITTSEMTVAPVALATKDRATLTRISRKLLRSAAISVADRVANEIGYAFADERDAALFLADGTTHFGETGFLTALGAAGKFPASGTGWAGITLANITGMMGILPSRFSRNRRFTCSSEFYYTVMVQLLSSAGGVSMAELAGSDGDGSFLGKPVDFTDKMPTSSGSAQIPLLYGAFNDAVMIGEREGISIATSDQRFFEMNQIAIRGTESYDIEVHEPGDGSNAGAFVGLLAG
ncbi:MAG: phage major capsid protein [Planctomycetota bacterium]